jgi:hypothetical protein
VDAHMQNADVRPLLLSLPMAPAICTVCTLHLGKTKTSSNPKA